MHKRMLPPMLFAALIFGPNPVVAQLEHVFDLMESKVVLQLNQGTRISLKKRAEGEIVWMLTPAHRLDAERLLKGWRADPLMRALHIIFSTPDTAELILHYRTRPRCQLTWRMAGAKLEVRVWLVKPADADYYLEAGLYYAACGQPKRALDQYRKALALAPRDARPYLAAAKTRLALGQPRLAAFNARRALTDPRLAPEAKKLLAQIQGGTKRREGEKEGREGAKQAQPTTSERDSSAARCSPTETARNAENVLENSPQSSTRGPDSSFVSKAAAIRSDELAQVADIQGDEKEAQPTAHVVLMAMLLAATIVAPVAFLLIRSAQHKPSELRVRIEGDDAVDPFEAAKRDVFEYLLAERMSRPAQALADEEQAPTSTINGFSEKQTTELEPFQLGSEVSPEHRKATTKQAPTVREKAPLRTRLESVYALGNRGLTVPEIARRLGMGKEEVRLALRVRERDSRPRVKAGNGGRLTLELVEE